MLYDVTMLCWGDIIWTESWKEQNLKYNKLLVIIKEKVDWPLKPVGYSFFLLALVEVSLVIAKLVIFYFSRT